MSEDPLSDLRKILHRAGKAAKIGKINRIKPLITLLAIAGCFFYLQNSDFIAIVKAKIIGEEDIASESNREYYKSILYSDEEFYKFKKESEEIDMEEQRLEKEIEAMAVGFPLEEMAPYIAKYDRKIAALIVGIAKKESNWGKAAPSKNGNTCYNYWGYKGEGSSGFSLGYGCFATAKEGVDAIGKRITELANQELDTPSEIVVWKCGRSCAATGGQAAADKWVSDVSIYFDRIVDNG